MGRCSFLGQLFREIFGQIHRKIMAEQFHYEALRKQRIINRANEAKLNLSGPVYVDEETYKKDRAVVTELLTRKPRSHEIIINEDERPALYQYRTNPHAPRRHRKIDNTSKDKVYPLTHPEEFRKIKHSPVKEGKRTPHFKV